MMSFGNLRKPTWNKFSANEGALISKAIASLLIPFLVSLSKQDWHQLTPKPY